MIYWVAYQFFKLLSWLFFPLAVSGRENLPQGGGFVIASNHISNLDPFIVGVASRRKLSYVAKDTLFKNKLLRFLLKEVEAFPIKRETSDLGAIKEILARLKKGWPVLLFPEGTRKRAGSKADIQSGVGFIAVKSKAPVIPVYIQGSDKVMPPGSKILRRHLVRVTFGGPLSLSPQKSYEEIASHIMDSIGILAK